MAKSCVVLRMMLLPEEDLGEVKDATGVAETAARRA